MSVNNDTTLIIKDCRELLNVKINLNKDYLDYEREKRIYLEHLIEYNKTFIFTSDRDYEKRKDENNQYIENPEEYFKIFWSRDSWFKFLSIDTTNFYNIEDWRMYCKSNNIKNIEDYDTVKNSR